MQQAGWYPDPSGAADVERYWDGVSWSTVTRPAPGARRPSAGWTPTGVYDPTSAPPPVVVAATPTWTAPPPPRRLGWIAGIVALVVATALLGLFLWRPWAPLTPIEASTPAPPSTQAPTTTPSGSASTTPTPGATVPAAPPSAALDCTKGAGFVNERQDTYSSYDLTIDVPGDWGWRYTRTQWTWLNQAAVWGKKSGNSFRGFALGGVLRQDGFTSLEDAASGYLQCLSRYGVYNDGTALAPAPVKLVQVAGRPAVQVDFTGTSGSDRFWNRLLIVDTGAHEGFASLLGFADDGDEEAKREVQKVLSSARRG